MLRSVGHVVESECGNDTDELRDNWLTFDRWRDEFEVRRRRGRPVSVHSIFEGCGDRVDGHEHWQGLTV